MFVIILIFSNQLDHYCMELWHIFWVITRLVEEASVGQTLLEERGHQDQGPLDQGHRKEICVSKISTFSRENAVEFQLGLNKFELWTSTEKPTKR